MLRPASEHPTEIEAKEPKLYYLLIYVHQAGVTEAERMQSEGAGLSRSSVDVRRANSGRRSQPGAEEEAGDPGATKAEEPKEEVEETHEGGTSAPSKKGKRGSGA
jgi:hypothetical protein